MSGFEVWFLFVGVPAISKTLIFIFIFSLICAFVMFLRSTTETLSYPSTKTKEEHEKERNRLLKKGVSYILFSSFVICSSFFIPSQREIAAIIVVPAITQSEKVHELGGVAMTAAINLFNQWVNDITSEGKPKTTPTPAQKPRKEEYNNERI